MQVRPS